MNPYKRSLSKKPGPFAVGILVFALCMMIAAGILLTLAGG